MLTRVKRETEKNSKTAYFADPFQPKPLLAETLLAETLAKPFLAETYHGMFSRIET